jgi:hypothetical protein
MVQEAALSDFRQHGFFTIVSVMEPDLMASDPSRIAFRQMMGVFAQYDKSMVVLELLAPGRGNAPVKAAARAGRPSGTSPARPRLWSASRPSGKEGLGFDRIATRLNEEGVPSRTASRGMGLSSTGSSLARKSRELRSSTGWSTIDRAWWDIQ